MQIKDGVRLGDDTKCITTECLEGMLKASQVYAELGIRGVRATITSVMDGRHMPTSKHYEGNAFDLRTWNADSSGQMPQGEKEYVAQELRKMLGSDYDVVVEKTHIHVEYDPKL